MFFRRILNKNKSICLFSSVSEGSVVPNVPFKIRVRDNKIEGSNPFKWKDVSQRKRRRRRREKRIVFVCF